jgi:predicted DNA binding CopG/RHH family protein
LDGVEEIDIAYINDNSEALLMQELGEYAEPAADDHKAMLRKLNLYMQTALDLQLASQQLTAIKNTVPSKEAFQK